jgi:hypothetical protein
MARTLLETFAEYEASQRNLRAGLRRWPDQSKKPASGIEITKIFYL